LHECGIKDSEALVQAGAPLVEIGDPFNLEVVADILSTDAPQIEKGAAVPIDGRAEQPSWTRRDFLRYRRSGSRSNGSVSRSVTAACETRRRLLEEIDRPALRALPATPHIL